MGLCMEQDPRDDGPVVAWGEAWPLTDPQRNGTIIAATASDRPPDVLFAVRHARRARRWSLACQAQDVRVLQVAPSADPELARILLGIQHAAYAIEATLLDR